MKKTARGFLAIIFAAYAALALAIPFAPTANDNAYSCTNASSRRASPATISGQTSVELQNRGTATIYFAPGRRDGDRDDDRELRGAAGSIEDHHRDTGVTHFACIATRPGRTRPPCPSASGSRAMNDLPPRLALGSGCSLFSPLAQADLRGVTHQRIRHGLDHRHR
jgi:hypothetical protein